jgi:hypothetical protein
MDHTYILFPSIYPKAKSAAKCSMSESRRDVSRDKKQLTLHVRYRMRYINRIQQADTKLLQSYSNLEKKRGGGEIMHASDDGPYTIKCIKHRAKNRPVIVSSSSRLNYSTITTPPTAAATIPAAPVIIAFAGTPAPAEAVVVLDPVASATRYP